MRKRMWPAWSLVRRCSIACVVVGAAACSPDSVDKVAVDPGQGQVLQSWTIEGSNDAAKCAFFGASQMRVVLFDAVGSVYATQIARCDDFRMAQFVRVQPYTGIATLFDDAGDPVSRDVPLGDITPVADSVISAKVDFAATDLSVPPN